MRRVVKAVTCQRCRCHYVPGGDNSPRTPTEAARDAALDRLESDKIPLPGRAILAQLIADHVHAQVHTSRYRGGGVSTAGVAYGVEDSLKLNGIRNAAIQAAEAYLGSGKLPGTVVQAAGARAEGGAS